VIRRLSRWITFVPLPLAAMAGVLLGVGGFTFWYARGYSYFFSNPVYCTNCHIMRDHYQSWKVSRHRGQTCNDCHLPHALPEKYLAKADEGLRHSLAFTFENVQVLRIIPRDRKIVQGNCVRCHREMVSNLLAHRAADSIPCTRCHRDLAHVF
jgi:cytochrome c nitrite reductase small subunit